MFKLTNIPPYLCPLLMWKYIVSRHGREDGFEGPENAGK